MYLVEASCVSVSETPLMNTVNDAYTHVHMYVYIRTCGVPLLVYSFIIQLHI